MFKKFFSWLITSSADPEAVSLAVKGALVGVVAIIVQWAPVACGLIAALCIDTSQLSPIVDAIATIIKATLEIVSAIMLIVGVLRKIYLARWAAPKPGVE